MINKPTRHNFDRIKAIDYYFDKISSEEIPFSAMRKEMLLERINSDEINTVVRLVDNALQDLAIAEMNKSKGRSKYIMGWILFITGTLATGLTLAFSSNVVILAFGTIAYGIRQITEGRSLMNNYVMYRQRRIARQKRR